MQTRYSRNSPANLHRMVRKPRRRPLLVMPRMPARYLSTSLPDMRLVLIMPAGRRTSPMLEVQPYNARAASRRVLKAFSTAVTVAMVVG